MERAQRSMKSMSLSEIGLTLAAPFLFGGEVHLTMVEASVNNQVLASWDCTVGEKCWKLMAPLRTRSRDTHRGVVCGIKRSREEEGVWGTRVVGHGKREVATQVFCTIAGRIDGAEQREGGGWGLSGSTIAMMTNAKQRDWWSTQSKRAFAATTATTRGLFQRSTRRRAR